MLEEAEPLTVVNQVDASRAVLESTEDVATLTKFVRIPGDCACTVTVTVIAALAAIVPKAPLSTPLLTWTTPWLELAVTKLAPAGNESYKATSAAPILPELVMLIVYDRVLPTVASTGPFWDTDNFAAEGPGQSEERMKNS